MAEQRDSSTRIRLEETVTHHTPASPPLSAGALRAAPPPGKRIGKYVVERTLGSGGMGIVVAAHNEDLGEPVAIKLLHPKAAVDKVHVERFVREARATARIKSEHVVRVLDAGEEEGTNAPYIVMEYLHGKDVGRVISETGPLEIQHAVDVLIQVCEAVSAAHALGIIHRDLKPSNFFLTERADGTPLVKVLDFGISKLQVDGVVDPKLTETQAVFGSPTYMSPEQVRSAKNVDARSDVWSLGVALFEMLCGRLPFVADNVSGLLASVVADPPRRLYDLNPDVPGDLEAIVLACLEKDVTHRIQSASELAARLAPFASHDGMVLAARLARTRLSSSPSVPPGASSSSPAVAMPSIPPMPPLPPLSRPPPPSETSSRRSGVAGVALGTTDGDLSSTEPSARARARRRTIAAVAVGFAAALLISVVVIALARTTAPSATAAPAAPRASASVDPAAVASASASGQPAPLVTPPAPIVIAPPAPSTSASAAASAGTRRSWRNGGKGGAHGAGAATGTNAAGAATLGPPITTPASASTRSATDDRF